MKNSEELKKIVREKYSTIANQEKSQNQASCCGSGTTSKEVYNIMTEDYSDLKGYAEDADLGLGCGLPTQFAKIEKGDTVIDLGSGAGNDCFIARHEAGETGKIIGIDFTPAMIKKARINSEKLGFNNVEFREGDVEDIPVSDNIADVVVSNCVLNLVPDKQKVLSEISRVLKPGGHFSISDIVLMGNLPKVLEEDAELYAGCVSGAIQKAEYLRYIEELNFQNITIQKEKQILLPDDILEKHLSSEEIKKFKEGKTGIFSISVFAEKEGIELQKPKIRMDELNACTPGSACC